MARTAREIHKLTAADQMMLRQIKSNKLSKKTFANDSTAIPVSKSDRVLLAMAKGEKLTTHRLRTEFGMARPWDHIQSLIARGHKIRTFQVESDVDSNYVQNAYSL